MLKRPAFRFAGSALSLAVTLLIGACATAPSAGPPAPEPGLYGVAGGRLVTLGRDGAFEASGELNDVGAMTYDAGSRRFYAVVSAEGRPQLVAVDPDTGETTPIGPIAVTGLGLTLAEGLAADPGSGTLYAAGGESTFASSVLLTVDPATGAARQVARIRGTIQDEVDALVFAAGALYAVDGAGGKSALYRVDPDTGQATRVGAPFVGAVRDLAFDPASRRLFGARGKGGPPLIISLDGAAVGELGVGAEPPAALAVVPAAGGEALFADGFESGDASAWPASSEQRR